MRDAARLFQAEWLRSVILMRRYLGNTVGSVLGLTVVFLGLFFSTRYVSGMSSFGERLDSVVVGYVLWSLILFVLADVSMDAQNEAQTGTLEQICLSRFGLTRVFVLRSLTRVVWTLLMNAVVLSVICLVTGTRLHLSPWLIVPVASALMGAFGLAFMFGALALGAKRIQQLLNLANFALLFVVMTPFEKTAPALSPLLSLLPMVPGAAGVRTVMVDGSAPSLLSAAVMLIGGALWFGLGMQVFRRADRAVRTRGLLGSY